MARCSSCSAPLPAHDPVCPYCGTRNRVDLLGVHEYTVTAPESDRACPRCAVPLKTINIQAEGTFLIEHCTQCFGFFFDPGELEALLESSVQNVFDVNFRALHALAEGQDARPVRYGKCPVCGTMMNRVNFGTRSGVVVDQCKGHGVWLDGGELSRLLEWKKAGGQLLDEKVRAERKREEEKNQKERQELAKSLIRGGGSWEEPEGSEPSGGPLADLVLGFVDRLFR